MEENAIKQTVAYIPENQENLENEQQTEHSPNSISSQTNTAQNGVPEYNDPDYMPPQDGDYIPMEEIGGIPSEDVGIR